MGLLSDGEYVWVAQYLDETVAKLGMDGTILATYPVGRGPYSLAAVGGVLWVTNFEANTVTLLFR